MKIRVGFVSNSSSASFCCEFCGDCWDSDHAPMITAGLCNKCKATEKVGMCNCCGEIKPATEIFETDYGEIDLNDLDRLGDTKGESISLYETCGDCLIKEENNNMLEAWMENADYSSWLKKVSNPDHILSPADEKISELLLSAGK